MIVVFGSLNMDMVMQLERLPRSGDTVLCPHYQLVPGGKGANQAIAAAKAGADVKFYGRVGNDNFGQVLLDSVSSAGIDLIGLKKSTDLPTGCAMVCVDEGGENMITVATGANLETKESEIPGFLLSKGSTLLLQMETCLEENWKLIKRAHKIGARIILNLAPVSTIPHDILKCLDILVVNQSEAAYLGLQLGFEVISPFIVAKRLAMSFELTCIVTLGKEGALACTSEGTWDVGSLPVRAVDTTAAGDAFVGVLAATLDEGGNLSTALQRASVAGGLACINKGAQTSLPTASEIEANLDKLTVTLRRA